MLKDLLQGKPLRHPLHTFLVHFPIGLFALSLLLDLASHLFSNTPGLVRSAFYALLAGIVTALLAAVPGFVDYQDIPRDKRARRIATAHMILNLLAVALFAVSAGWRGTALDEPSTPAAPLILSALGAALLTVSGYLGGHLVYDDGIGVGRHRRHTAPPGEALRFKTADADANGWEQTEDAILVPVTLPDRLRNHETLRVEIDGQQLVLAKIEGVFHAFQEFCTHRFGPLSDGHFHGGAVMCPWHRSCFDVATGKVMNGPAKVDLKIFRTEVRAGKVCIVIPRPPGLSTS